MASQNCLTSACRYCRFYRPEGLHGGACQQLGVSVRSEWKACQLGLPAFSNTWENVEQLAIANRIIEIPAVARAQEVSSVVGTAGLELNRVALNTNN
jgi:hypothetical protein